MSDTLPRLRAVAEKLAPALAKIGLEIGDEHPEFATAAAAFDDLIAVIDDLHREARN